jgi:co-chaperonin GroES (HSP10)|tara:strand:+ start:361 stop:621 length:261 start_codon:yes stop_codon:yes gene_type:complete
MIKAINNKVLILPDAVEETTASGIILTEMQPEIQTRGTVVSVGNKVEELKEGDYVMYQPTHAIRLEDGDKEYLLFPESSIIAKINI